MTARCHGSPYPAQNRQRKNGLSDRRRVPRGDSDGRTAERCFQWATLAGLSSRIQPFDAQTQSARPAGVSAHTQQGVQAFAAGRRSRRAAPPTERSHPSFGASVPTGIRDANASPRELSNPTQSTRTLDRNTTQVLALRRWRSARARRAAARADGANGYVPMGPSESQHKAAIAGDKSKAQANKAKFPKGKKTLDIADWLVKMAARVCSRATVVGSGRPSRRPRRRPFDLPRARTSGAREQARRRLHRPPGPGAAPGTGHDPLQLSDDDDDESYRSIVVAADFVVVAAGRRVSAAGGFSATRLISSQRPPSSLDPDSATAASAASVVSNVAAGRVCLAPALLERRDARRRRNAVLLEELNQKLGRLGLEGHAGHKTLRFNFRRRSREVPRVHALLRWWC